MAASQREQALSKRNTPLLLVVDDDVIIRSMLNKVLEKQAYDVIEAPNGAEAVELFEIHHPDMVLLDVLMPMMNGFEACEKMRQQDPERMVPILMLTGLDDVSSVDKAFDAGATDFITKPINWSLFAQRVKYALKARDTDIALRKSQHRIRHALQVAKLGYWDWDLTDDRFHVPDNVLQMLGINEKDSTTLTSMLQYVADEDKNRVFQAFNDAQHKAYPFALEHRIISSDRTERYVYQQAEVIKDKHGKAQHILGTVQDISALKRAEDLILHQAYHDLLTDLPNQALLKDRLKHAMKVAEHAEHQLAVISLDIDRFQLINESLGHDAGNILLIEFASFIRGFIQEGDTVSRISGNEFALLLESLKSVDDIELLIRNLRQGLKERAFNLLDEQVYLTLSLGVAIYPDDDIEAEGLMQSANAAMRKAKAQGGDQECFYTHDMNRRVTDRLRMETDLRLALEQNELELFYQPQVDVSSRKIIAMEALVRWNHPEQGVISPVRFIPLAEETGLIQSLGQWVLEEALRQTKIWHDQGWLLKVGINLSARQFMQDDLLDIVASGIQQSGLAADYIDLEITETIAMQDAESSIQKMHQLKDLGVHLSMDDFGTGYSSLSYLHQFPLDVLKIDRSFVKDIEGKQGDGAIARAVIAMAHSMDLDVIAEGVETEQQYDFLQRYECNVIQGYLISKPLPAAEFEKLLKPY